MSLTQEQLQEALRALRGELQTAEAESLRAQLSVLQLRAQLAMLAGLMGSQGVTPQR